MLDEPLPRTPRIRLLAGVALTALVAGLGTTAVAQAQPPAPDQPVEEVEPALRTVRICDTSVCLTAWQVVDSDDDGVSDADELMAGTDPHDAKSRPGLSVVVELVTARKSPSYEAGQAFLQVLPAEIQARREEGREVPVAPALPVGLDRGDSLTRLGIDVGVLAEHGIDASTDGFVLGLDRASKDGDLPPHRVGGIDIRLVSADDAGAGSRPQDSDDPVPLDLGHGEIVEHIDYGDWSSTKYADGAQTVCNDSTCKTYPPGSSEYYTDPDYDTGSVPGPDGPTDEQKQAFERRRGAIIRTVEGWTPMTPDTPPEDPWTAVILVDPEATAATGLGVTVTADPQRVTTAQPEGARPDMPSPRDAAPGGQEPCTLGCEQP